MGQMRNLIEYLKKQEASKAGEPGIDDREMPGRTIRVRPRRKGEDLSVSTFRTDDVLEREYTDNTWADDGKLISEDNYQDSVICGSCGNLVLETRKCKSPGCERDVCKKCSHGGYCRRCWWRRFFFGG